MARRCEICDRGPYTGNTRSHSKIASKVRRLVNLQTKTVAGEKMRICTSCIRDINTKKEKAAA
jgi:large subunit ribosomal protein L28